MTKLSSLTIIIPTHNNETTIGKVVKEALKVARLHARSIEVLVCNDGSTDATTHILKALTSRYRKLRILSHDTNRGYGESIKELYTQARSDWIFSCPGDYQIHPEELTKFLSSTEHADMILGWRRHRHDPALRLVQSYVYNAILRMLFGSPVHDVNSVRLVRRALIEKVSLLSHSAFVDAELVTRAQRAGFTVSEVVIGHYPDSRKGSGGSFATVTSTVQELVRFFFA